jgi:hypothetical protein
MLTRRIGWAMDGRKKTTRELRAVFLCGAVVAG